MGVTRCSLQSMKPSSPETLRFRDRLMSLRLTHPCGTGQARSKGQLQLQSRATGFPGLIPITDRSSNCRLGAGLAFRLLLRAGILLWAHPQPRVKWNKITTRKHLASPFLWTRSGSPRAHSGGFGKQNPAPSVCQIPHANGNQQTAPALTGSFCWREETQI